MKAREGRSELSAPNNVPSLVFDVNRALAIAMQLGACAGLDELDAILEREVVGRYPYALAAYVPARIDDDDLLFLKQIGMRWARVELDDEDTPLDSLRATQQRWPWEPQQNATSNLARAPGAHGTLRGGFSGRADCC